MDYPTAKPLLSIGGFKTYKLKQPTGTELVPLDVVVPIAGNLTKDLTVEVALDTAALNRYNNSKFSNYQLLPSDAYTLAQTTIVIPKGNYKAPVSITVNMSKYLSDGKAYVLPISLVGAGTFTIDPNYKTALIHLTK